MWNKLRKVKGKKVLIDWQTLCIKAFVNLLIKAEYFHSGFSRPVKHKSN